MLNCRGVCRSRRGYTCGACDPYGIMSVSPSTSPQEDSLVSRIYFDPVKLKDGVIGIRARIHEFDTDGTQSAVVSHVMTVTGAWRRHSDFIGAIAAAEDGESVDEVDAWESYAALEAAAASDEAHPNGLAF